MMDALALEPLLAALAGLLIGSFLNVCIYRWPRDLSVVAPRSFCPGCGCLVSWYDNIPVLSFALLGGRCRRCGLAISWRYPLVELATACLFGWSVWRHGVGPDAVREMILSAFLLVLLVSDLETRILPDEITVGGTAAGWALALLIPRPGGLIGFFLPPDRLPAGESLVAAVLGGVIPAGLLWTVGELYWRLRGREGLGFGDVKMMLLLGAFLGLEGTLEVSLLAGVFGSCLGIVLLAVRGRDAAMMELPFGSFLAAAALAAVHAPLPQFFS
jgi:leader peptidase (prepilin peptidase)/N-methyltransferase